MKSLMRAVVQAVYYLVVVCSVVLWIIHLSTGDTLIGLMSVAATGVSGSMFIAIWPAKYDKGEGKAIMLGVHIIGLPLIAVVCQMFINTLTR